MHLAAGLACLGYRVVLVDADPQGSATVSLGVEKRGALYDLLVRDADWIDCLEVIPPDRYALPDGPGDGALLMAPGNTETRSIEAQVQNVFIVRERLQEREADTDFVVMDTSPSPSMFHSALYLATDYILHPTETERLSILGLLETIAHIQTFSEYKAQMGYGQIETLGIVPTMYRANTANHSERLKELVKRFGALVWTPIPLRTEWSEATLFKRPVWSQAPSSKAARDAWRLVLKAQKELANVQT